MTDYSFHRGEDGFKKGRSSLFFTCAGCHTQVISINEMCSFVTAYFEGVRMQADTRANTKSFISKIYSTKASQNGRLRRWL